VSFLLSLSPLACALLAALVAVVWNNLLAPKLFPIQPDYTEPAGYVTFNTIFAIVEVVFLLGYFVSGVAAIVTSSLALRRAMSYPPQQAWRGFALAGLVLGIVCMVIRFCAVGPLALLAYGCRNGC
jgi:hypothetical protein